MKWSITYYMGGKHSFTNYFTASRSFPFTKRRKKNMKILLEEKIFHPHFFNSFCHNSAHACQLRIVASLLHVIPLCQWSVGVVSDGF